MVRLFNILEPYIHGLKTCKKNMEVASLFMKCYYKKALIDIAMLKRMELNDANKLDKIFHRTYITAKKDNQLEVILFLKMAP